MTNQELARQTLREQKAILACYRAYNEYCTQPTINGKWYVGAAMVSTTVLNLVFILYVVLNF